LVPFSARAVGGAGTWSNFQLFEALAVVQQLAKGGLFMLLPASIQNTSSKTKCRSCGNVVRLQKEGRENANLYLSLVSWDAVWQMTTSKTFKLPPLDTIPHFLLRRPVAVVWSPYPWSGQDECAAIEF
jgi:hypothetical protein